jgi:diguanylate cyclase (GGDEF)-like protein/PAS domain S-box-containing protein
VEKKTILLVDDAPVTLIVLRRYLEETYTVLQANNGKEALELMKENDPDLVILDIMMPGMNGFELCKIIKEDKASSFTPVIILSSLEDHESRVKGLDAGADEFIIKPVDRFELNMRVKTLLKIKELYDKLETSEKLFKTVFNNLSSGINLIDTDGKRIEVNDTSASLLGYSKKELLTNIDNPPYLLKNKEKQSYEKIVDYFNNKDGYVQIEDEMMRKDGTSFWAKRTLTTIKDNHGKPELIVSMFSDITESINAQREINNRAAFLKILVEAIPMPMYVKNVAGMIIECNQRFEILIGKPREELIGVSSYDLFDREIKKRFRNIEPGLFANGGHAEFEANVRDAMGSIRNFAFYKETFSENDEISGLICVMVDLTQRKNLEEELKMANNILRRQAITDGLTGLFNHKKTLSLLEKEVSRSKRYGTDFSILMMDIDYFKHVNDQYGHQVGDKVLAKISDTIRSNIRETDIAGRYGGEEFLIIFPETEHEKALVTAHRIADAIKEYEYSEGFHVTVSGGLAGWSGEDTIGLVKVADDLLYKAKNSGRDRIETT